MKILSINHFIEAFFTIVHCIDDLLLLLELLQLLVLLLRLLFCLQLQFWFSKIETLIIFQYIFIIWFIHLFMINYSRKLALFDFKDNASFILFSFIIFFSLLFFNLSNSNVVSSWIYHCACASSWFSLIFIYHFQIW